MWVLKFVVCCYEEVVEIVIDLKIEFLGLVAYK